MPAEGITLQQGGPTGVDLRGTRIGHCQPVHALLFV